MTNESPGPMAGRTVLVTGGTGGIGRRPSADRHRLLVLPLDRLKTAGGPPAELVI